MALTEETTSIHNSVAQCSQLNTGSRLVHIQHNTTQNNNKSSLSRKPEQQVDILSTILCSRHANYFKVPCYYNCRSHIGTSCHFDWTNRFHYTNHHEMTKIHKMLNKFCKSIQCLLLTNFLCTYKILQL